VPPRKSYPLPSWLNKERAEGYGQQQDNAKMNIRTFTKLDDNLRAFANGDIRFMILVGDGGLGKSWRAKRFCKGIRPIKCHAAPLGVYLKFYEYKDDIILIDDLDEIYHDKIMVKMLKAATENEAKRLMSWLSMTGRLRDKDDEDDDRVPREFYLKGPILLISNDWSLHTANLRALADRARLIYFCPSPDEVHREVQTWFKDKEIVRFVEPYISQLNRLSMRVYLKAKESKKAGLDWKQDILQELNIDPVTAVINTLLQDKTLSQYQRAKRFKELTGHDRATYYRRRKAMREPGNDATLRLVAKSQASGHAGTEVITPPAKNGQQAVQEANRDRQRQLAEAIAKNGTPNE